MSYGSTGKHHHGRHAELVDEFGALPLPDRVALLEEYHEERARASVRSAQYPSVKGTLQSAAQPRPYEHREQRAVPGNQGRGRSIALAGLSILTGSATFVTFDTIPIFESLRDAIGFSSFQVVLLNAAPLLFAALFAIPAANFTQHSPLWDLLVWSCSFLMLGTWISACALMGSPLEYMLLGQWFVGLSIAVLATAPAKFATFWYPSEGRSTISTAWGWSVLLGMGAPFLIVPYMCGADGQGKHLGSFLLFRAVFGTFVAAMVTALKSSSGGAGKEEDEVSFYKHSYQGTFWSCVVACAKNGPLVVILSALALTLSSAYSFVMFLPFVLSLAPSSFTPLIAGMHIFALAPAGLIGIAVVRSKLFFGMDHSRKYKPAVLSCIAACAAFLAVFAFLHGRANPIALTSSACGFAASAAALLHIAAHAVLDVAFPAPEPASSAFASGVIFLACGLAPIVSILLTHPLVLDYPTDDQSPTGLLLSMAGIFWMALLVMAFAIVVVGYNESSAYRLSVGTEQQVASHVVSRVANDLREARVLSEMFVPLAKGDTAGAGASRVPRGSGVGV